MTSSRRFEELQRRLVELEAEKAQILTEIAKLKRQLREPMVPYVANSSPLGRPARAEPVKSTEDKIVLFLELFRCRESVYPKRWENHKTGKQGYSPVCSNEWKPGVCHKPKVKCAECRHQAFNWLDTRAVESHLMGHQTIGTYAIREDDTCIFLACDFDEEGWQSDVAVYRQVAGRMGIDVGVERSRSGNGAHAWIFFEEPVSAREARMLGTLILSRCQEDRHQMDFGSFDRLFPNQDVLPSGGFGNLIALPLQKKPREAGNSVFLDDNFDPYPDQQQWTYLSGIRRLSAAELRSLLAQCMGPTQQVRRGVSDEREDLALLTDQGLLESEKTDRREDEKALLGRTIEIAFGAQLQIPVQELPSRLITKLKRTASFANPEFYKQQRMRMQSYPPPPRFIFSGELRPDVLLLPRGCLDKVKTILSKGGAEVVIRDERLGRKRLKVEFNGKLTDDQEKAVAVLTRQDTGVLVAPPGAGKTVMGCALIAKRKVTTLVLVHRQPLLEQWKERLQMFLGLDKKEIGTLGGSKKKPTGKIDLAMLQTLTRMEDLEEIAESYAQIIIDEAHHIPAASFEGVMKMLPARYVVGLTATPYRKDGLEKILFQQCGPIRHTIDSTDGGRLHKKAVIRETSFRLPAETGPKPAYHELLHHLTMSPERNRLIAKDVMAALTAKRFPVVISDRKDHLDLLEMEIAAHVTDEPMVEAIEVVRLDGDMGKKQRREAGERIERARSDGKPVLLLATGSLIGEGFDLPILDTLVLATPLSFKGRMVQYAGRLHRFVEGKEDVLVYDYVDSSVAMLISMYRKRVKTYRDMWYKLEEPVALLGARSYHQASLFQR